MERTGFEGMFVTFHVWLVRVSKCFEKSPGTLVS